MKTEYAATDQERLPFLAPGIDAQRSGQNYSTMGADSFRLCFLAATHPLEMPNSGPVVDYPYNPRSAWPAQSVSWPKLAWYSHQPHSAEAIRKDNGLAPLASVPEHFLVPAGHMALVEGWHVGVSKAAVVLAIQSTLTALPIWLSLRAELGEITPPDWSDWQTTARALIWTATTDWSANITDTIYLQGIRAQLTCLPIWMQEFLASIATCFLDIVLTTPLYFYWQKAIAHPQAAPAAVFSGNRFGQVYAGAGAMLANNLAFMNVFYPLNELTIRALNAEHVIWRQVAISIVACVVAKTAAWPAEWVRAQLSMPANHDQSAWSVLAAVQFSMPTIFRGFSAQLLVAMVGGVFSGLANKFLRRVPVVKHPAVEHTHGPAEGRARDNRSADLTPAHPLERPVQGPGYCPRPQPKAVGALGNNSPNSACKNSRDNSRNDSSNDSPNNSCTDHCSVFGDQQAFSGVISDAVPVSPEVV